MSYQCFKEIVYTKYSFGLINKMENQKLYIVDRLGYFAIIDYSNKRDDVVSIRSYELNFQGFSNN